MTLDDDPRALWGAPLLDLPGAPMPWEMERFTPGELTDIAEWLYQRQRALERARKGHHG